MQIYQYSNLPIYGKNNRRPWTVVRGLSTKPHIQKSTYEISIALCVAEIKNILPCFPKNISPKHRVPYRKQTRPEEP